MKIAIIGIGNIGVALGRLWTQAGHRVTFGSEHPNDVHFAQGLVLPSSEAIVHADTVTVAIPFKAWPDFAQRYRAMLMKKIVLDTTNTNHERDGAIADQVAASGLSTLMFVSALLPGVRLVKAFNTMESNTLSKGRNQPDGPLAHPIAGDDQAARDVAAGLVRDAGFEAVITGDAATAATFDQGTPVWNHPRNALDLAKALGI